MPDPDEPDEDEPDGDEGDDQVEAGGPGNDEALPNVAHLIVSPELAEKMRKIGETLRESIPTISPELQARFKAIGEQLRAQKLPAIDIEPIVPVQQEAVGVLVDLVDEQAEASRKARRRELRLEVWAVIATIAAVVAVFVPFLAD